jgi:hypothetical protein
LEADLAELGEETAGAPPPDAPRVTSNEVFVVHGRDSPAKIEVARLIERAGLQAVMNRPNTCSPQSRYPFSQKNSRSWPIALDSLRWFSQGNAGYLSTGLLRQMLKPQKLGLPPAAVVAFRGKSLTLEAFKRMRRRRQLPGCRPANVARSMRSEDI